ncbi:MAG: triose-phosphate isomerase, partial [Candidatus Magasanikbacteria bacterium]|nr:triose-phosphate isomerase [Candidatus Magasanikbacteria bacterium]
TGEISPDLLIEAGCDYVIIGHSERRQYLLLNYEIIHKELRAVLNTGKLVPIVCIGETAVEKKEGQRDRVLFEQLQQALTGIELMENQQIIVAYEPIWAIGTGDVITPAEAAYAHKIIRLTINDMFGIHVANHNFRIVYGGSVKDDNVHDFLHQENIDGFLVGGDSLNADKFYKIAKIFTK